jgi:aminoglycoside phosphotransferase family enzyme
VALNRRTAPDHYLGVRRITRQGNALAFDGDGPLVDAAVEMRRFDQDALLDRLATRGALGEDVLERLAQEIARFHDGCEPDPRPASDRSAEVASARKPQWTRSISRNDLDPITSTRLDASRSPDEIAAIIAPLPFGAAPAPASLDCVGIRAG